MRLNHINYLVKKFSPDVILLQEIKTRDISLQDIPQGYHNRFIGQKSYNGVAILSKLEPIATKTIFFAQESLNNISQNNDIDTNQDHLIEEARYIEVELPLSNGNNIILASVYVPNGTSVKSPKFSYKLNYYQELKNYMIKYLQQDKFFVLGGDFNVAPENIDVYDPEGMDGTLAFHIKERQRFRQILIEGFYDSFRLVHPQTQKFSWWDYRDKSSLENSKGMRIDQILVTPNLADRLIDAAIHEEFRSMIKPSDHAPISIKIDL